MPNHAHRGLAGARLLLLPAVLTFTLPAQTPQVEVHEAVRADLSAPLATLHAPPPRQIGRYLRPLLPPPGAAHQKPVNDPVVQTAAPTASAAVQGLGFEGIAAVVPGQPVAAIPPDANLAVGPNHIVQWVNVYFAVYNKSGTLLAGPTPGNALWSGFGGPCETENQGDPIVQYDRQADRWVMTQFANSSDAGPFYQCFAISQTGDPLGAYYRYAFAFSYFNDYTKLGVWPSAYFTSHNMFLSLGVALFPLGVEVCGYERAAMLQGAQAKGICYQISDKLSLLPVDLDGAALPPDGAPGYYVNYGGDYASVNLFQLNPNFANPSASVLSGPRSVAAAPFNLACGNGGTCVPQPGTTQQIATLGDRMMYRLSYRRFEDHESLAVSQAVAAGNAVGIRWYEIRDPGGTPVVYQQGTYAPDASYRWVPSIAMDKQGNLAMGYSRGDAGVNPSIYITGRTAADPPGQMQAEQLIIAGSGSQTDYDRWGDYTAMDIDPSDDCTFWYTNEYLTENGSFNWHTRIASFRFDSCGASNAADFGISVSPASKTVLAGADAVYAVTVTPSNGFASVVNLSLAGLPAGASASFDPATLTGGGTSTLTVSSPAAGNATLTITGTSGALSHSAGAALSVTDFTIAASPASATINVGGAASYTVSVSALNGFSGTVTFAASGLPAGAAANFTPASVTASGSSTLSISGAPQGTYTITITGTSGTLAHSASVSLTVGASPDFTISAVPASNQILAGQGAQYTVTITGQNGFAGTVSLGVTGYPAGSTASLTPPTVTGSGASTLMIGTPAGSSGNYTLKITGIAGAVTHTATAALVVQDFTVSVSPAARTVNAGKKANYTVTVGSVNGFSGPVSLSVTGLPPGATAAFSPQPVTPPAGSTANASLTVTTAKGTTSGAYSLVVTGTNSGASRKAPAVTLTIR